LCSDASAQGVASRRHVPLALEHNMGRWSVVRLRTPLDVVWWGMGLTAVMVPLVAAALGSNLVMIPLVFLGAAAVVVGIFWRWGRGPRRAVFLEVLNERSSTATYLTYLVGGIGTVAVAAFVVVVVTVHWHTNPCFCGDAPSLLFLLTLALSALAFSFMANLGLLATVTSIFWFTHRSRT
jgi:hypothetical protein